LQELSGEDITLRVGKGSLLIGGRAAPAVSINGMVPGPLLRLKQDQRLKLTVINELDEETSLHWHGLVLPFQMDGVPGVSFPGIPARSSFTYEFPITQRGTYWYHSHSGLQEMLGCYAPIVIEPAASAAPMREHVVLLSDHSFVNPARILANLKADPGHYNRQPQTLADLAAGRGQTMRERLMWAKMRMDPTDIADVTGAVLHYLVNGHGPADNWTGLFTPGAGTAALHQCCGHDLLQCAHPRSAVSNRGCRWAGCAPGDGRRIPVRSGETYDVIVTPQNRAYTIAAETMDRSGMARATLAPIAGMMAPVPPLRARPLLTMKDMGMDMPGTA
jgi:CopA family copper-resistance protein